MARSSEPPGFSRKRKVLFNPKTRPERMLNMGRRFMEAERYDDALEFFARCEARAEVERIVWIATERGDAPLLLRAKVVLKEAATEAELTKVARAAEAAGRLSMALVAWVKAGREDEVERIRARMAHMVPAQSADGAAAEVDGGGQDAGPGAASEPDEGR